MRDVSMNLGLMLIAAAMTASSIPSTAQQADTATQTGASVSAGSARAPYKANPQTADASGSVDLRPVSGELQEKLDSKTAKVGDSVVVKTKAAVKTADGIEIPKGTKLVGRVTDVQARGAGNQGTGNADSRVTLEFDRAELKDGQSVAIRSVIESVEPPVDPAAQSAAQDSMDTVPAGAGPGGSAAAGGRAPGGALAGGGLVRGTVGGGANTTTGETGVGSAAGSTIGGAGRTAVGAAGDATARVGSSVHQVPGVPDPVVAHATGVAGVSLANEPVGPASASTSGTLFATKKNVRLDSGTQITLGVAGAANK